MFCAHLNRSGALSRIGLAVVCVVAALVVRPAWATNCSYSLAMSEDLGMLNDPNVSPIVSTSSAEWTYLRKHPYLEVTNDATSDSPLYSLNIQLNNVTSPLTQNLVLFNTPSSGIYSTRATDGSSPTIDLAKTMTTLGTDTTGPGSSITLYFDNFDPGATLIFRLELDPSTKHDTNFADYRQVFTKFSSDPTNVTGNATSSALFGTTGDTVPTNTTTWSNLPVADQFITTFGIAYACLNSPDLIIPVPGTGGSTPPVPEPSTMVLAGLGLVGVLLGRSRLRVKR